MNGGYMGIMEAVSRGAAEADGRIIGVTCNEIEKWRSIKPNKWISQEIRFETLQERLFYLVNNCNVAIAFPGGIGTITEIFLTWNMLAIGAIKDVPIWLVGYEWRPIIASFFKNMNAHIPQVNRTSLDFYDNIRDIFNKL